MISIDIFDVKPPNNNLDIDVGNQDCYNYVLQGSSSCGDSEGVTIPINTVLNAIRYEETEEGTENGAGAFTRTHFTQKRIFSFQVDVDDYWYEELKQMMTLDQLWFGAFDQGPNEIVNLHIGEAEPIVDTDKYEVVVTFQDPEIVEMSGCCGSLYEDSPYEGCDDDDEGSGEPDPEDPCPSFEVDVEYDGNAINASTTGGPATGGVTYRWYYDSSGSGIYTLLTEGGVSSVVPAGAGRYRVIAVKGGCQSMDEILVQDECSLFQVVLTMEQGVINSQIISGQGDPSYVWIYIDEESTETTLSETGSSLIPEETGFYRLEVEDEDCTGEDTIYVDIAEECGMEVTIERDDMTLTASAENCEVTVTYEWKVDYGDGNGQVMFGSGPSVEAQDSGVYFVTAQCGDQCNVTAYAVVMKPCNPCDGLAISISEDEGILTANTTGGSGGVITWYVNDGGGRIAVGTGPSIAIEEGGMYIAEWVINDCKISSEYLECSQEGSISFEDLCNE